MPVAEYLPISSTYRRVKTRVSKVKADGRVQRSQRSRQEIINALLGLMKGGNYIPTAQQVADEAGISIRTVFRHFSEMELLYQEVDAACRPTYEAMFENLDYDGSLEERVRRSIDVRIDCYLETLYLEKATHALMWRSEFMRKCYGDNQRRLRKNLENMLPELKKLNVESREAADATSSFEFFDRLQNLQGLSTSACSKLMTNLLLDIIKR